MPKKKHSNPDSKKPAPFESTVEIPQPLFPRRIKLMAIFVFILATSLYVNTVFNDYALDDGIVITENNFTRQGLAGIPGILTSDAFSNITKADLAGGRYRPLCVVTFAVEVAFFGLDPSVSHLVNALLYGILCLLIFIFFRLYVFRDNIPAAFIATLIFSVHPLHTDAVANIKGRDELLSLLLLVACMIFYLRFSVSKKPLFLIGSLIAFFLSLLSKENGITFIAIIPLLDYFFIRKTLKSSLPAALPFIAIFAGYFFLRYLIAGLPTGENTEVMNAPFLLATAGEAFATKLMVLGKDLWMLVFPHPLSYDYSYSQVPYVQLSNWKCILSVLANFALLVVAIRLFNKRHVLSFAILFYFITLSIVSNFVFDVGSPFNERFLFQPSLGFAMAAAFLLTRLSGTRKPGYTYAAYALVSLLLLAGGIITVMRNPVWKNNDILFSTDVLHAPNSAKTNNFAAIIYLNQATVEKDSIQKQELFEKAIRGFQKALLIHPDFADPYINLGNIFSQQGKLDTAKSCLMRARAIHSGLPALTQNLGYLAGRYEALATKQYSEHQVEAAIRSGNSSLECDPGNINMLYNLGGFYLSLQNTAKAKELWTKALSLDPGNATIKQWLDRISATP
jgi:hypothetical protein